MVFVKIFSGWTSHDEIRKWLKLSTLFTTFVILKPFSTGDKFDSGPFIDLFKIDVDFLLMILMRAEVTPRRCIL